MTAIYGSGTGMREGVPGGRLHTRVPPSAPAPARDTHRPSCHVIADGGAGGGRQRERDGREGSVRVQGAGCRI
eukprot:1317317-Rhodomonas_salina.1